jgi:hypothetical protein
VPSSLIRRRRQRRSGFEQPAPHRRLPPQPSDQAGADCEPEARGLRRPASSLDPRAGSNLCGSASIAGLDEARPRAISVASFRPSPRLKLSAKRDRGRPMSNPVSGGLDGTRAQFSDQAPTSQISRVDDPVVRCGAIGTQDWICASTLMRLPRLCRPQPNTCGSAADAVSAGDGSRQIGRDSAAFDLSSLRSANLTQVHNRGLDQRLCYGDAQSGPDEPADLLPRGRSGVVGMPTA